MSDFMDLFEKILSVNDKKIQSELNDGYDVAIVIPKFESILHFSKRDDSLKINVIEGYYQVDNDGKLISPLGDGVE